MDDVSAVELPDCVPDARLPEIECVVVGQRHQIESHGGQRVERFRRCEKASAFGDAFARQGDGGFEVGEDHVAVQQAFDDRNGRWFGRSEIRAEHRLSRQDDRECGRLRRNSGGDHICGGGQHRERHVLH
jgi:hypothetical protein